LKVMGKKEENTWDKLKNMGKKEEKSGKVGRGRRSKEGADPK
jgi:hypothetical protein